jgi:hypothetical protein
MPEPSLRRKRIGKVTSARKGMVHLSTHPNRLAELKARLPNFEPIDFRSLVLAAKKRIGPETIDEKIELQLGERLKEQTEEVLRGIGVDPKHVNWKSAFMRLANIHHGVGRLVYTPKRTNSNARKWNFEHDSLLLEMLWQLKAEGLERSAAIEKIIKTPELRDQFPYETRSKIRGRDKLAKTLRERARKLHSRKNSLLETGGLPIEGGEHEKLLLELDIEQGAAAAKNETD